LNIHRPKKKSNVLNDKRIKSCLSRFDSGAYSRLQFLRAVSHSVGDHTLQPRVDNSSNSKQQQQGRRRGQAGARASSDNFSGVGIGTTAAATTSDDCCEVYTVAPRAGFALVPCGHRTRTQYTRRRNDNKENF